MKRITAAFWACLLLLPLFSFQVANSQTNSYTKSQIQTFVREVFAGQADVLVLQSQTSRYEIIEEFLSRLTIVNQPEYHNKKFKLLSTVPLQNKYNPALTPDAIYDAATFNPLKYLFPMTSKSREIFRFDHSDWLIIIEPIK